VVRLRSLGLGKYEAAFRENEIDETEEEIERPDAGHIIFVGRCKMTAAAKCRQTLLWGVP
jgi:hypothetical protein